VEKYLIQWGKVWRHGVWIPHVLSRHQLQYGIDACMDLVTSHHNLEWLRNLITGDEKWILYINYVPRRQWLSVGQTGVATLKTDIHPKKVMLSVWWGVKGVIRWETRPNGCTITTDLYCQQLDWVAQKFKGKPGLI
jgi:[histone H3]-lysine36 N-dimethyltransferase SETMAR